MYLDSFFIFEIKIGRDSVKSTMVPASVCVVICADNATAKTNQMICWEQHTPSLTPNKTTLGSLWRQRKMCLGWKSIHVLGTERRNSWEIQERNWRIKLRYQKHKLIKGRACRNIWSGFSVAVLRKASNGLGSLKVQEQSEKASVNSGRMLEHSWHKKNKTKN